MSNIVVANIGGQSLEVVDGEWVTLRSLFEPFEKEVSKQVDRLDTWANLQKVRLPSRGGAEKRAENLPPSETWTIHRSHVAMAIAELDPRGMSPSVRDGLIRYKRVCAPALDDYFSRGSRGNASTPVAYDALVSGLNQGRVSDHSYLVDEVRLTAQRVARATGQSIQKVYGHIRRDQRVSSPFAISPASWVYLRKELEKIERGTLLLPKRSTHKPQLELWAN